MTRRTRVLVGWLIWWLLLLTSLTVLVLTIIGAATVLGW